MASQTETQSSTALKLTDSAAGLDAVFLRVGLAVVLLLHSLQRFGLGPYEPLPLSGFAGFLGSLGVPVPGLTAWVVTLVELVGGLLLLVGLFTRAAAPPSPSSCSSRSRWFTGRPASPRTEPVSNC